jgi:hypothetical protein
MAKKERAALSKEDQAADLLDRAADRVAAFMRGFKTSPLRGQTRAESVLNALMEVDPFEDAPDRNWWRDYYLLTGDHMVCTEEGWVPAEMNAREVTGEDPDEVLDEVNAPVG